MVQASVVYRIDKQDKLLGANAEWDRFALENSAGNLVSDRIASQSLWDFISDTTTRFLYRDILKKVRAGHRVSFPFRCDSADCRRFLEMHAYLIEGGAVEFEVRTLALEKRPPQPVLDGGGRRTGDILRMCGWCKKMPDAGGWIEIEEAVAKMNLFESDVLPVISHGICEECDMKMRKTLIAPDCIRS